MRTKLRQKRLEKELTQKDMAQLMHKEPAAYQRWESGHTHGTGEDLLLAAKILGCNVEDLVEDQALIQNMNDIHNTTMLGHGNTQHNYVDKSLAELFTHMMDTMLQYHRAQMELLLSKFEKSK